MNLFFEELIQFLEGNQNSVIPPLTYKKGNILFRLVFESICMDQHNPGESYFQFTYTVDSRLNGGDVETMEVTVNLDEDLDLYDCVGINRYDADDREEMDKNELMQIILPFLGEESSFREFLHPIKEPDPSEY